MNASDLMTSDVVVVRSTDAIGAAVETLTELDIRHLPVVDDGELVGMLSDRDLRELGLAQINDVPDIDRIKALGKLAVADVMSSDVQTVDPGTSIPRHHRSDGDLEDRRRPGGRRAQRQARRHRELRRRAAGRRVDARLSGRCDYWGGLGPRPTALWQVAHVWRN
jgi:hypothetical protein